jgi:hypothetical protein
MNEREPIKVWRFNEAPVHFQELSCNGGDEDWVALVPAGMSTIDIFWLHSGSAFGCCEVEEHEQSDGSVVCIGCHS